MQTTSTTRERSPTDVTRGPFPIPDSPFPRTWLTCWLALAVAGLLLSAFPTAATAQSAPGATASNVNTGNNPKAKKLQKVTFDQHLDQQIPFGLEFTDENGDTVPLGRYFQKDRPVIVVLGYFECPMLCNLVRKSLVDSLAEVGLQMGRDYAVVSVSIDPDEGPKLAQIKTRKLVERYRKEGGTAPNELATSGWHSLTGDKKEIRKLADVVGFRYRYDEQKEQYLHPSGFAVAAPDGSIARYFFGVTYKPRDLRLGLVDASKGQIGSPIDQVLLRCYQYNPETGSYSFAIMRVLRFLAVATAVLLAFSIWMMFRTNGRLDDEPTPPEPPVDDSPTDEEGS